MDLRSVNSKNYYDLLGISPKASAKEIRTHYHDLARVYHPDSNYYSDILPSKISPEHIEIFNVISAAYQTLIDPEKRKEYDLLLSPLGNKKLCYWEDSPESSYDRSINSSASETPQLKKRIRTPTFGQTGAHPYKALREQLAIKDEKGKSLKDFIQTEYKKKSKRIFLILIGIIIGMASASVIILKLNSSILTEESKTKASESAPPSPWKRSLDG